MKILFFNPPYVNFNGIKESGGHSMPLGLAYLASYLRERINCDLAVVDAEARGLNYEGIKQAIIAHQPDLIGITCPTPTMDHVFRTAEIIKKEIDPKITIVVGGVHPTALPLETIKNPLIDFVVAGEGEITFYELIKKLMAGQKDFEAISGLYFKKDGQVIANPPRGFIADLDIIPYPARDLFDLKLYCSAPTKKVSDQPAGTILTSRGCAYNCVHCISRTIWGRQIRFRSTQNVMAEIEECINKFGIKEFNILDDTFTLNQKRALEICAEIIRKKLGIAWIAFSRANTLTDELAEKMKLAGCKKISFGLESGSQAILNLMRKQATIEEGRRAVAVVVRHGILAHASFMFGNIGETEETIKETVAFAKSLPLDNATFFITSPFPGTELYEIAKASHAINEKTKWEEFAPLTNAPPILVQDKVSKDRLIYWQKRAFKEFYLRPKYILFKLKQLNSFGAVKNVLVGLGIFFRIAAKQTLMGKKIK